MFNEHLHLNIVEKYSMGQHYHAREEYPKYTPKNGHDNQDIRVLLAEYILNFQFPRDVYGILITTLVIYISLKMLRFSLRLFGALIRPAIYIGLLLVIVPYIYDMKSGVASNRMASNMISHTGNVFQSISGVLNSIYTHTVRFYAKNF